MVFFATALGFRTNGAVAGSFLVWHRLDFGFKLRRDRREQLAPSAQRDPEASGFQETQYLQ
ncbi:MAG: hypothetical protein V3U93_08525 [Alphaproteobacteria bacterium]